MEKIENIGFGGLKLIQDSDGFRFGIDAVLLKVSGFGTETTVEPYPAGKSFLFVPFSDKVREAILRMAGGEALSAEEYCKLNALLGHLYAEACLKLAEQAGLRKENVDLVGCHGQTVWHAPMQEEYLGKRFGSTLQIGDASVISEEVGCLSVSDFRVRDVAAGGQGAPLVPYTDFLLYRDAKQDTALQNIGGIGNVTILPADCSLADVRGFDTGPGNMLLDALAERITDGKCRYDKDGLLARQGNICDFLLHEMLDDPYLAKIPPKTTGREKYGLAYLKDLFEKADYYGLTDIDLLATCTRYTAECIKLGICRFGGIEPRRLIVTGGGEPESASYGASARSIPRLQRYDRRGVRP